MKLSISELKESNSFLNIIFENITSAIFLVDKNVHIQQFNETFKGVFNRKEDEIIDNLCGNVIGCQYPVEENTDCGKTTNCKRCILRRSILKAFNEKSDTIKKVIDRNFYIYEKPSKKYFQFTTKHINYNDEDMVMLIFDDVTEIENSKIELEKRNEIIESYNNKIKEELAIARNVQLSLIPSSVPKVEGLNLHAIYNPLDEIGGDLYDFIKIDEDNMGIFISDISGHGVPAAMITTMVKAIMETSRNLFSNPPKLMDYLNKKIVNLSEDMYLTAFYGVYNNKTKEFTYVRCAHPYPIIIRDKNIIEITEGSGTILGMFENISFESETILLKNKDKLIFYTDGLSETKDKCGKMFSENINNVIINNAYKNIDELVNNIYHEVHHFKEDKKFNDDVCILGMEIS